MRDVRQFFKPQKCFWSKWVGYALLSSLSHTQQLKQTHSDFSRQVTSLANEHDYAGWLKDCILSHSLSQGHDIHSKVVNDGLDSHPIIGSALVNLYSKCGSLEEACKAFDRISIRDVVLWSSIIIACANRGHAEKGLYFFKQMQLQKGLVVDKQVLMYGLKSCAGIRALDEGRRIHIIITKKGLEADTFVGNSLVDMYCKCVCIVDAQRVFENCDIQDVVLWTALIDGYVEASLINEALQLFQRMHYEGVKPNNVTYECILKACSSLDTAEEGIKIHIEIEKLGFFDSKIGVRLVHMLCTFGKIDDAYKVFSMMDPQDVVTWTVLLNGYAEQGYGQEALKMYQSMRRSGRRPDEAIFVCILQICSTLAAFHEGQLVYFDILLEGLDSLLSLKQSLMGMYMKCASPDDAHAVLESLQVPDIAAFSIVIAGYASLGHNLKSLNLYELMQTSGLLPNEIISTSILQVCASLETLEFGKLIHEQLVILGLESDIFVRSTLIDMYSCCRRLEEAFEVFKQVSPDGDAVLYNTMIGVYIKHDYHQQALRLSEQFLHQGLVSGYVTMLLIIKACSDIENGRTLHALAVKHGYDKYIEVQNTVIGMYSKTGSLDDARFIFKGLQSRSLASYNALLAGESCLGHMEGALDIYQQMSLEGIHQNQSTFVFMLRVCTTFTSLHLGRFIYMVIVFSALDCDPIIASAVMDFFGKAGSLREAVNVFNKLYPRDEASWNMLLAVHADNGCIGDAQNAFMKMQGEGVGPGSRTFLCLLNASSHAGIPELSFYYLQSMKLFRIVPNAQHIACLIDSVGRAGLTVEANIIALNMPIDPSAVAWTAPPGSCLNHRFREPG